MYYECFRPEYGISLIDTKLTLEDLNVSFYKTKKDKFIIFK